MVSSPLLTPSHRHALQLPLPLIHAFAHRPALLPMLRLNKERNITMSSDGEGTRFSKAGRLRKPQRHLSMYEYLIQCPLSLDLDLDLETRCPTTCRRLKPHGINLVIGLLNGGLRTRRTYLTLYILCLRIGLQAVRVYSRTTSAIMSLVKPIRSYS